MVGGVFALEDPASPEGDGAEPVPFEGGVDEGFAACDGDTVPGSDPPAGDPPARDAPPAARPAAPPAPVAALFGSLTDAAGESEAGAGTSVGATAPPAEASGAAPACLAPEELAASLSTRVPQPDSRATEITKAVTVAEI